MVMAAALLIGGALWMLGRGERPLYAVEACWLAYGSARSAAESALVDARRVDVTPAVTKRDALSAAPYTCGIWRMQFRGGAQRPR
jgi:hypothetical protein